MKRKTIAVCVTGYNWEYESRVIDGMRNRCSELDINLLVFASMTTKPELNTNHTLNRNIIAGETEIFNLINYEHIDGIAILGDSIISEDAIYNISEKAQKHGIPVVNINDPEHKLRNNIILSDKTAMEFVVRHLVQDHGVRKINFIGGFLGNLQTEERLYAYKKVLAENNIPIEEERIAYGEFWKKSIECTENFLKADELPEAIVCASDSMAFFCIDCLKSHGYRIPEDIIVTGFDDVAGSENYDPPLTTVRRAFAESGEAAVDILIQIWAGKDISDTVAVNSVLECRCSCGCKGYEYEDNQSSFDSRYGLLNKAKELNYYILETNSSFSNAKSAIDIYNQAQKAQFFFNLKSIYICVCSEIEDSRVSFKEDNNGGLYGISENMVLMNDFEDISQGTRFPSAQLIPVDILNMEKPCFCAFSPIYFKNIFIGYIAYEPSKVKGMGDFFITWLFSLSNNLGIFYMQNELEDVVDKLENLYIRDPLTGLYNRRGMDKLGKQLIEQITQNTDKQLTVICVDIDRLKPINDSYGHEAGDNAILQTANAIKAAMPQGSISVRTGGDEYCIILVNNDQKEIEEYIANIDDFLSAYNKTSQLPYQVGCSCGFFSMTADSFDSIESMIKIADALMYKQKAAKKADRI